MRRGNPPDSMETLIAAANAIASAEIRAQPVSVRRKRWRAWFGMFWCFGSHGRQNRMNQAVLVPEPLTEGPNAATYASPNQSSRHVVAPPSSPSSLLQSEPPSTTQSPAKFFSLSAIAANSYSPTGSSIFAIGPYANDTKLVTPPVFSTFTTEPSTAPVTPPEPVQQTNPSSPEVPFAKLLSPSFDTNCKRSDSYDFQPYHLHPGSPISNLISPGSVCSGTSSPFHETEFYSSANGSVHSFPILQPPQILAAQGLALRRLLNGRVARDNGSILDGQIPAINLDMDDSQSAQDKFPEDEDISFEFTAQEVAGRMEQKPANLVEVSEVSTRDLAVTAAARDQYTDEANVINDNLPVKIEYPSELGVFREFNFKVKAENGYDKNWVFFPLVQPGVS